MSNYYLANKLSTVSASLTLAISAKTTELKAAGEDVIGLSAGEPDFNTPKHILKAAKVAIDAGHTKYTAVDGIPELKQAIIAKFKRNNNLNFSTNEVMVSTGGKQTIFNALMAILNAGDEVIIPAPYWVSYPDIVKLMAGVPVIINCNIESYFKINAQQLEQAINTKTRALILNSPSNPTGAVYSAEELQAIAAVLEKNPQVIVIADDMYEHILIGDKPFVTLLEVAPNLRNQVLISNGVSKAYAMTGWRIGYIAGPEPYIKAMKKIQGQCTSNPNSIAQYATLAALNGPQDALETMLDAFKERHALVMQKIANIDLIKAQPSDGAFYSFIDISASMAKKGLATDVKFCEKLLEEQLVAVVPGSAFGLNGYMRISFATSLEKLNIAFDRIKKFTEA